MQFRGYTMTPRQIFWVAAHKAQWELCRGMPLHKLLNRMEVDETNQIVDALAQQFALFMRDAAERIDVKQARCSFRL
jgi:hypothetical protein